MTTQTVRPSWLAVNGLKLVKFAGLGFVALASFAAAFTHMHDWTAEALPTAANWLCWSNAVISEILPTVSFILWREREEMSRPSGTPLMIFLGSVVLSIFAQLSATGVRFPHDAQLLACLPALALLALAKVALGDLSYARKAQLAAAAEAEQEAELARNKAARNAELKAEQERNYQREQAELAAERDARRAEQQATERARLAEIEQAAITERERMAAAERAEMRRREEEREARDTAARAEAFAAAELVKAEAQAERIRADAALVAAQAAAKEQAAALLAAPRMAGVHRVPDADATVSVIRQRRSRAETRTIADAALSALPAGTSRDAAVKAVARAIDNSERYAREFVPPDWSAGSSAADEGEAA